MPTDPKVVGLWIIERLEFLIQQEVRKMSESIDTLKAKVDQLAQAEAAREARDVAQDAVTQQQIAALQKSVSDLQAQLAAGGLTTEQQATLDSSVANIQAVIDSLNAADPTPPAAPAS